MRQPNPKNYDFLWLVNNQTYFETSFWLTPEYLERDFITTGKGPEWKVYVGKKERDRLSRFGFLFFQKRFNQYKGRVKKAMVEASLSFKKIALCRLSSPSNLELRKDFLKTIAFAQRLWKLYFFTEYFLHDKIAEEIEKGNPTKKRLLLKKVKEMQKIKFELRKIVNKTISKGSIFDIYFEEISKRTKRRDLHFLRYQEVANLLAGKSPGKINRKNYVWGKFNNWQLITGKEALKIINSFDQILKSLEARELKGQIANEGFYQGRVKIIPFDLRKDITKEMAKMKKGEVLVSGSTGPEMILACKKAGAIVTEEGGICSHAAIVSRELEIPCVIGTKIATRVLKDGDIVEVNADRGVVRKLNK